MTTTNDNVDAAMVNDLDQTIVRAIGEELRRARASAGWTRPQLVRCMTTRIPVNTYAGYERGIRQCSIPRLVEICQALGVDVAELIELALQRLELDMEKSVVQIDLHKVVLDERTELRLLRRWARNRMKEDTLPTESHHSAVVRLQWSAVKEIATLCGVSKGFLRRCIREFAPESALRT